MWSEEQILNYLQEHLKESRYKHTLGVCESAIELAKIYSGDEKKARIAALLHDCGKYLSSNEIIDIMKKEKYPMDKVEQSFPEIMHGRAGAYIAKEVMGIDDDEILSAIRFHTTGKEDMNLLEKIIYLADYIEPYRNYPGVDELREKAFSNLDEALLLAYDNTLKFVLNKGQLIHMDTIKARNKLLIGR